LIPYSRLYVSSSLERNRGGGGLRALAKCSAVRYVAFVHKTNQRLGSFVLPSFSGALVVIIAWNGKAIWIGAIIATFRMKVGRFRALMCILRVYTRCELISLSFLYLDENDMCRRS
jgi:hypothetical protein